MEQLKATSKNRARAFASRVTKLKLRVGVQTGDIEIGRPRCAAQCMEKIAIERELNAIEAGDHKVRIAAQGVKFNLGGYRYAGMCPRTALKNLVLFDKDETRSIVRSHSYILTAERTTKIAPTSPDRKRQINEARHERKARARLEGPEAIASLPDLKKYRTIANRLIGADLGPRGLQPAKRDYDDEADE